MTVGDRIKKFREQRGITQTDLASGVGISKQSLYKYENNIITNIPSDKIEAIARKLEISPATLMGWDNNNEAQNTPYSENADTDRRIKILARHIDEFPEEQRKRILNRFEDTLEIYLDFIGEND